MAMVHIGHGLVTGLQRIGIEVSLIGNCTFHRRVHRCHHRQVLGGEESIRCRDRWPRLSGINHRGSGKGRFNADRILQPIFGCQRRWSRSQFECTGRFPLQARMTRLGIGVHARIEDGLACLVHQRRVDV